MRRLLSVILVLCAGLLASCGRSKEPQHDPRKDGKELRCPVEGTLFEEGTGIVVEHGAMSAVVCSNGCAYTWKLEPERFAGRASGGPR